MRRILTTDNLTYKKLTAKTVHPLDYGIMVLKYTKHEKISLKSSPEFGEAWLQDRISDDPTILRLGDVDLLDRERNQGPGRLDLLLQDSELNKRYEVELMLGATDASHVIRTIEYWDIERRRYPAYEHVAVLVAEDVTSRYLNVLSLFSGSIPLVCLQLTALKVGDQVLLEFSKVLDQVGLRTDDETVEPPTDRAYWNSKRPPEIMKLVDDVWQAIKPLYGEHYRLNYKKSFLGLTDGFRPRNSAVFRPAKRHGGSFQERVVCSPVEAQGKMPVGHKRVRAGGSWHRIQEREHDAALSELLFVKLLPDALRTDGFVSDVVREIVERGSHKGSSDDRAEDDIASCAKTRPF